MFPIKPLTTAGGRTPGMGFFNNVISAVNSKLSFRHPLAAVNTGNGIQVIHTRPHRFKWFSIVTQDIVDEAASLGFEITEEIGVSKKTIKDCNGEDVVEDSYSVACYENILEICTQETLKTYGEISNVYFPYMTAPFVECDSFRAVWNYERGRWESDYRGPTTLAVYSEYLKGSSFPYPSEVYCNGNATGKTVDVWFDWGIPEQACSQSGEMIAKWFECDCKWRAIGINCCEPPAAEECVNLVDITDDFTDDTTPRPYILGGGIDGSGNLPLISGGKLLAGVHDSQRYSQITHCFSADETWPVGEYVLASADFFNDNSEVDHFARITIGNAWFQYIRSSFTGVGVLQASIGTNVFSTNPLLNDEELEIKVTKINTSHDVRAEFTQGGVLFATLNANFYADTGAGSGNPFGLFPVYPYLGCGAYLESGAFGMHSIFDPHDPNWAIDNFVMTKSW